MSASFFGVLKAHNHTSQVGDGGTLSNLQVTGTVTSTGKMTAGADPTAALDLTTLEIAAGLSLLFGV